MTMLSVPQAIDLPLRLDEQGGIRVSSTRVTLDTVIACYKEGETPESIHEAFPTLPLANLYAVIAYYVANRATAEGYLAKRLAAADARRSRIKA
jgi:uncharacterized protein (DUF433 family)